jgi:acetyl-CoA carboxylase carboxyltransferase component
MNCLGLTSRHGSKPTVREGVLSDFTIERLLRGQWIMAESYAVPHGRATALFVAAERGFIDEVIEPAQTRRPKLIRALALLENKRDTNPPKKHGNIPL